MQKNTSMKKKRKDAQNKDEEVRFADIFGPAKDIKYDRVTPYRKKTPPTPKQSLRERQTVLKEALTPLEDVPANIETGEELLFARPGIQNTVLRKLRRGQYAIAMELDLHGLRIYEAEGVVKQFLQQARTQSQYCIRIIHGKGMRSEGKVPVLKQWLNRWLRQQREVLAFCSAKIHHGGTGAVYILLKKS